MSTPTERVEMWSFKDKFWRQWNGYSYEMNNRELTKEEVVERVKEFDKAFNTRTTVKFGRVEFAEELAESERKAHHEEGLKIKEEMKTAKSNDKFGAACAKMIAWLKKSGAYGL